MKRLMLSLCVAALVLPMLARADETRWDALRVYRLADGRGVAVAFPAEWQEVSRTRELAAGAPARFIDGSGRRVQIPAEALVRAADAKAVARPEEYRKLALRSH
jgi:hypothetical protein